jgi:hypothetical protein
MPARPGSCRVDCAPRCPTTLRELRGRARPETRRARRLVPPQIARGLCKRESYLRPCDVAGVGGGAGGGGGGGSGAGRGGGEGRGLLPLPDQGDGDKGRNGGSHARLAMGRGRRDPPARPRAFKNRRAARRGEGRDGEGVGLPLWERSIYLRRRAARASSRESSIDIRRKNQFNGPSGRMKRGGFLLPRCTT